ncbi:hypothetical protein [Mycoplasmopsis gallopavonis]|uniref:Uncharacterized protein conserved in bacteria n=1 Tax=Mycoplasmopsis gallopavonis TaxID=76629 RepID=A0A449B087_9BACT|nr:hypothetical protein [Mycoplasmopsis gallopavonis]VEU73180.1 Uncharacterized protein conserved in bacteria [Mycoplasmopsis gallopavonis]
MKEKMTKSSFSWEIKKEIINNTTTKPEIIAFINGLIFTNAIEDEIKYELRIKNQYILEKILKRLDKIKVPYYRQSNWKNMFYIYKNDFLIKEKIQYKDHLTSFFAGVFCGGGYISSKTTTSYHLEISKLGQ